MRKKSTRKKCVNRVNVNAKKLIRASIARERLICLTSTLYCLLLTFSQ